MQNNTKKMQIILRFLRKMYFTRRKKASKLLQKLMWQKKRSEKVAPLKKVKSDSFNELDFFLFFFLFFYLSLSLSTLFLNECDLILSTTKFK